MEKKKVSIIVPVYNLGKKLCRCVQSIENQTYQNLQILLIDDGSIDDSLAVCQCLEEKDNRIQVLHHENHGVSYTRNCGIDAAKGEYIMFIDGDDDVLSDMVQRYVEEAEETGADIVVGGIQYIEEDSKIIEKVPKTGIFSPKEFWKQVCEDETGLFGYVPNKLYRTSLLKNHHVRFREDMAAQEDLEFALSAYRCGKKIRLFSYCGYLYYHVQGKREMPVRDLVGNQMKLLHFAEEFGVPFQSLSCVKARIQGMVYVSLFYADNKEKMQELRKMQGICVQLKENRNQPLEVRIILTLFLKGYYLLILCYFQARKRIKRLIKSK